MLILFNCYLFFVICDTFTGNFDERISEFYLIFLIINNSLVFKLKINLNDQIAELIQYRFPVKTTLQCQRNIK